MELRPLLNLLIQGPKSVTDLAEHLELNVQRAYYLVQKLVKVDVASVITERRGGRTVKMYAVPQPWFIPYEVTTAEALESFVGAQVQPRIEERVREILRVYVNQTGDHRGFWLSADGLSLGDDRGTAQDLWEGDQNLLFTIGAIRLTAGQVKELKRSLVSLAHEEHTHPSTPRQTYDFAVLLVPRRDA
ncbi:winged helix-turn-helix domain-containing protein [Deinococcus radiotolerans]|uniref:winged helix-turn-helix domain-containing protein n=1 Tax=Deinococcus radiotolerans TaxID=1309407 RepID=UPI001665B18C|nr:winged helix-turn-helix domain-containing protein [Deinococcus radiotolerans]